MLIASYNCKGFKNRNYNYLCGLFNDSDILLLQEHWLFNFEFDIFGKLLNNCLYTAKSGMKDYEFVSGRPYGGVAILWSKLINCKFEILNTNSNRLCAVKYIFGINELLVLNVYMPNFMGGNEDEFFDILTDIYGLVDTHNNADVVLGGDFNCNLNSNNLRSYLLKDFIDSSMLKYPTNTIDFTFRGIYNVATLIDYFFVSENLNDNILKYDVYHDGDNLSDHDPIVLEINDDFMSKNYKFLLNDANSSFKPILQWNKVDQNQISFYRDVLNSLLDLITVPNSLTCCGNRFCDTHYNDFNYFMLDLLNCLEYSSIISIPGKKVINKRKKPGWNEYVDYHRQRAIFWHRIWIENNCPADGYLADIRRSTRKIYHQSIDYIKKNENSIVREKVSASLKDGNPKSFWNNINKINGSQKICSNNIDGVDGERICDVFKQKYETLYSKSDPLSLHSTIERCRDNVEVSCMSNCNSEGHLHKITSLMVRCAVKKLKKGKLNDSTNIFSDAFINGTDLLFYYLSLLFTFMLTHSYSHDHFNVVILSPLVKDKRKNVCDSDNYRALALNTTICKIFDYIILDYFEEVFDSSQYQFAYKKNHSTSTATYIVSEVIQYYNNRDSNVIAVSLDCSKAFDTINYVKMFEILFENKLCPLVIRILVNMYMNNKAKVKWNGKYSDLFNMYNGVKQGGVMSPKLFTLYSDVLIKKIVECGLGCHMGDLCCSVIMYADDIILLSPTRAAMNQLLKICEKFGKDYSLSFNSSKSQYVMFGRNCEDVDLYLNNEKLNRHLKLKYLGVNLKNSMHNIFSSHDIVRDLKVRSNVIHSNFSFLNIDSKIRIFNGNCLSFYGSNLLNLNSVNVEKIDIAWRVAVRRLLTLHPRTHCNVLPGLMSTLAPSLQIMCRMVKFFNNGLNNKNYFVKYIFENCLNNCDSIMYNNLKFISRKFLLNINNVLNLKKSHLISMLNNSADEIDWKINIIGEILKMRENTYVNVLQRDEVLILLYDLCVR